MRNCQRTDLFECENLRGKESKGMQVVIPKKKNKLKMQIFILYTSSPMDTIKNLKKIFMDDRGIA